MAKSYKKFPIVRQERVDKKNWNRKIRNLDIDYCLRGSQYKKIEPNWDNWSYRWSLEEAIDCYKPNKQFPTLESWINYWERCCKRK